MPKHVQQDRPSLVENMYHSNQHTKLLVIQTRYFGQMECPNFSLTEWLLDTCTPGLILMSNKSIFHDLSWVQLQGSLLCLHLWCRPGYIHCSISKDVNDARNTESGCKVPNAQSYTVHVLYIYITFLASHIHILRLCIVMSFGFCACTILKLLTASTHSAPACTDSTY